MMFYLSKILWFFFQPSSLLVLLFAAGAAYALLGKARPALRLFASGAALYAVFGLSPLANLLLAPLELAANAAAAENLDGAAGIIVLGGAIAPTSSLAYGATHLNDSADRMIEALRLAARYPALPVLFSGGIAALHPRKDTETEAARAQRFFEAFNLVPPRLILEDRSRNTLENAVLSARMLQPKPGQKWILVTSAFHMPRAKALFEAQGFEILARPMDFRTNGFYDCWLPFAKASDGLRRLDLAAKEWAGLFVAWLAGDLSRRPQVFPGTAGA
ncbi:MAG: YdcF family protein [Rhodomicrobium sp.]